MFSPLLTLLVPGLLMGAGAPLPRRDPGGDGEGRYRYLRELQRRRDEQEDDDIEAIVACMELTGCFD